MSTLRLTLALSSIIVAPLVVSVFVSLFTRQPEIIIPCAIVSLFFVPLLIAFYPDIDRFLSQYTEKHD